jgi:alkaline phosphatase
MTSSVGTSYEAYGKKVQGIPGFIDQVDIAQTMFSSVTEENQKNMVAGTTGADNLTTSLNIDGVQDTIFTGGGSDVIDLATIAIPDSVRYEGID